MQVVRGRAGIKSEKRADTFTGGVWGDSVLKDEGITVNNVFFEPGGHTFWHYHEMGQMLIFNEGAGYVVKRDGEVIAGRAGDIVYISAGEVHWHGAGPDSYLLHTAISLKKTVWLDEVTADDYQKACKQEEK